MVLYDISKCNISLYAQQGDNEWRLLIFRFRKIKAIKTEFILAVKRNGSDGREKKKKKTEEGRVEKFLKKFIPFLGLNFYFEWLDDWIDFKVGEIFIKWQGLNWK